LEWLQQAKALVEDHAGARTLFYRSDATTITCGTYLDSLTGEDGASRLGTEYAVRYLASSPLGKLTSYDGVFSVRPGHYVRVRDTATVERSHWEACTGRAVRYRSDSEYEEHFLSLLKQSVVRRTGPGTPIVAELSGGMDSSSIVCVSDDVRRSADPHSELLDTVSYFDDSEVSLNDAEYYTAVERQRGKVGIPSQYGHLSAYVRTIFSIGSDVSRSGGGWGKGYGCVLSGVGGDELLGGVPNHLRELSDHLVSGHLRTFARGAFKWCLTERTPLFGALGDTLRYTAKLYSPSSGPREETSSACQLRRKVRKQFDGV
jgi:asparagine synthase (glutamine-hydrolysing)